MPNIDLPYELNEDPDRYLSGNEAGAFLDVDNDPRPIERRAGMQEIFLDLVPYDLTTEEMTARVLLVAGVLYQRYPHRGLRDCLDQARVWEFG